jgi:hypothetical protein
MNRTDENIFKIFEMMLAEDGQLNTTQRISKWLEQVSLLITSHGKLYLRRKSKLFSISQLRRNASGRPNAEGWSLPPVGHVEG